MDLIWDGIREALRPIFTGNGEVYEIVLLSLTVSGAATGIALIIGLGMASLLAFRPPPGRPLVLSFLNSGMALPPVVAGLVVAVMLWRTGPLGQLHLLYTPAAIVVAQAVIATPVVTALSAAALQTLHPRLRLQILALGASRWQAAWLLFREARPPLLAAGTARFGRGRPGAAPSSRWRGWMPSPARGWPASGPTGRARARSSACWRCWSGRPPARSCSMARPSAAGCWPTAGEWPSSSRRRCCLTRRWSRTSARASPCGGCPARSASGGFAGRWGGSASNRGA